MDISYQQYIFHFSFQAPISIGMNTISTLRGILGMNLRSMCCISKETECTTCLYNQTCVYTTLFESFISKENTVLHGRNTAPHPYVLALDDYHDTGKQSNTLALRVTLFGRYTDYFPYVFGAFVRAGKRGFGKNRIPFNVAGVTVNGEQILESEEKIRTNIPAKLWKSSALQQKREGEILVKLQTPLRYKTGSALANRIEPKAFMGCLYRRTKTLCGFYGNFDAEQDSFDAEGIQFEVTHDDIKWRENPRYSARQKTEMSLGGMTGEFTLKGSFRQQDVDLIEFARLFGAGKNTNFGLGQLDVWERFN